MPRVLVPALVGGIMLLGVLVPTGPSPAVAQEATPAGATDCPATTPEENKELITRWYAALAGDTGAGVAELAADDIVYHDPSPREEPQVGGAGAWAGDRRQDYPDLSVTVEHLVAEGDQVAAYVRSAGTHQGDTEEDQGVPATGRHNEWVGMSLFRIECGKIAEIWSVADNLGRLRDLGVITDEELQSAETVATPAP